MSLLQIDSKKYYEQYHGHPINELRKILVLARTSNISIVWLAGDSSLDNKYWIDKTHKAIGIYSLLNPPIMKQDICFWLTYYRQTTINCAIEATTLQQRDNMLFEQDKFIKNNIGQNDTLIVSVGGNDIALAPSFRTIINLLLLTKLSTVNIIKNHPKLAPGMGYFIKMFKNKIENYIMRLCSEIKPKRVIVCMIYYPDEKMGNSWADKPLKYLGYNTNPKKLQLIIRKIFEFATSEIKIDGVKIIPFPMFKVLDGKNTNDYVARVEPSSKGGDKLAIELCKIITN